MTLAEVVMLNPAAAEVFDDLNIDYFCRGNRPLGDILKERRVSFEEFSGKLEKTGLPERSDAVPELATAPLRNLVQHIVDRHHCYLRVELPALDQLVGEASKSGQDGVTRWVDLHKVVRRLREDLELQMRKEEAILFPAIASLELAVEAGDPPPASRVGSVSNLIRVLGQEHSKAARELSELREITHDIAHGTAPQAPFPLLLRRLKNLVTDVHQHMHLEINVLFSRAIALEGGVAK